MDEQQGTGKRTTREGLFFRASQVAADLVRKKVDPEHQPHSDLDCFSPKYFRPRSLHPRHNTEHFEFPQILVCLPGRPYLITSVVCQSINKVREAVKAGRGAQKRYQAIAPALPHAVFFLRAFELQWTSPTTLRHSWNAVARRLKVNHCVMEVRVEAEIAVEPGIVAYTLAPSLQDLQEVIPAACAAFKDFIF